MKKHFYTILIILFYTTMYAQENMNLEKAITLGLENNFQIKVDEQAIVIAENNNSWARAGRYPTVDLRGYFNNGLSRDNNAARFLQGTFYTGSVGASLDANWVVFNGGRVMIAKEQFSLAVSQQQLNKQAGIHDMIRNVYQRYYETLLQQERLDVLKESLDLSKRKLAYEQTKREFGSSNAYSIVQFENNVIADSTNIVNQENQIEIVKRNLYNVLDLAGYANYLFPEKLSTQVEEIDEAQLKKTLSEENYTLKSLAMIGRLDALNTKLEDAARKPVVSINGSLGVAETGFKFFGDDPAIPFNWSNQLSAAVNGNVSWNIFDGGVKNTNIENARLQEEITRMNILEAQVELNNQLDILIANYNNQKNLLKLSDDQLQLTARNLEMTEERFKAGQLTSLDFRNVQNQYLNAAFNKVNAIYNLIVTKTEIDYLVGMFN